MANPLVDIPRYLKIYETYLGSRLYVIFGLTVFAGLSEGFGLLMLLPLFEGFDSGSSNGQTAFISKIINYFLNIFGLNSSTVTILVIIIIGFIVKGFLSFIALAFNAYLRGELIRDLKTKLFDQYTRMTYTYYLKKDTGDFTSIINEQINRAVQAFNNLTLLGVKTVNSFVYLTLACLSAWRFGLLAFISGIIVLLLFKSVGSYVRNFSRLTATENGKLSKLIIQFLQAFKYLKATSQSKKVRKDIINSIDRLSRYQRQTSIAGGFTTAVREPITVTFIVSIIIIETVLFNQALAPILVSIVLFYKGLNSTLGLQGNWQNTLEYIGSMEIVNKEFKDQYLNQEIDGINSIPKLNKSIEFVDVFFSYGSDYPDVIKGINIEIPAFTSVAFVGSSGAGKSTIADLISLIIRPQRGEIFIDGKSMNEIKLREWRKQIAYVSQDTVIFDTTIANNISMMNLNQLDYNIYNRVITSAKKAFIHDFIDTLPDGYNTIVGERGIRLSGGQKQRLFIARELFREPKVLILDEATSSLDSKSELLIKNSIDSLKGKITVIIIAHRLSTINNVDYLYVLEKGKVIEQGKFLKLRNDSNSYFSKLISMQNL